ncbi:MAG: hypothetical protein NVSMB9_26250 [Isosphaeraceae bacterium]
MPHSGRDAWGLWVIGTYKVAKALVLMAAGLYVFRLVPEDAAGSLLRLAEKVRLDPDNHVVHSAVARLSGMEERRLEAIGVGIVLYGLLYVVQGVGLLLQRRWAEYLVVVTTGFLIPFETFEVARRGGPLRVVVLLVNLGIVAYLVLQLRRGSRSRPNSRESPDLPQ